jgi:hypothetical protein
VHAKNTEPLGPPPWYVIALLSAAVVYGYLHLLWSTTHGLSLHSFSLMAEAIYADALNDWRSGADPYRTLHGPLRFVYPPVFLYVGGILARILPDHIGWYLYALVHVASTLALPVVLARYYFCQPWLNISFAMIVFFAEPRLTGILALSNGNIASVLYLMALLAGVPGLQSNRWTLFYASVFIGALIKPPLLLLLLIPLLTCVRQSRNSVFCVVAVAVAYLLQRAFSPYLYAGYRWSLDQQLTVMNHYGYGVLGITAGLQNKLYGSVGVMSFALSAMFSAAVIAALFLLRPRIPDPSCNRLWISLVLLSTILASPRILPYDADIALLAAYVIFVKTLQTRRLVALLVLLYAPSLIVPYLIRAQILVGCYETLLLLLAFAGGFATLWRKSAPFRLSAPQPV